MTTLTALTAAAATTGDSAPSPAINEFQNTQAQAGFWRRIRSGKSGFYFESSAGGSVFIPASELWTLVEAKDANLATPASS